MPSDILQQWDEMTMRGSKKGIRSSSTGFCVPCEARSANQLLRQPRTNALLALQVQRKGRGAVSVSDLLRNPQKGLCLWACHKSQMC
jgi:hypothetical protein